MNVWKRIPLTVLCCVWGAASTLVLPMPLYDKTRECEWIVDFIWRLHYKPLLLVLCFLLVHIGNLPFAYRVAYLNVLHAPKGRSAAENRFAALNVFRISLVICEGIRAIHCIILGGRADSKPFGHAVLWGMESMLISYFLFAIYMIMRRIINIERVISSAAEKKQQIDDERDARAYARYLEKVHALAADYEQIKAYERNIGPFLELVVRLKPESPDCDGKLADMKRNVIDGANRAIAAFVAKRDPLLRDEHYRRLLQATGNQYKGMFSFGRHS